MIDTSSKKDGFRKDNCIFFKPSYSVMVIILLLYNFFFSPRHFNDEQQMKFVVAVKEGWERILSKSIYNAVKENRKGGGAAKRSLKDMCQG